MTHDAGTKKYPQAKTHHYCELQRTINVSKLNLRAQTALWLQVTGPRADLLGLFGPLTSSSVRDISIAHALLKSPQFLGLTWPSVLTVRAPWRRLVGAGDPPGG